MSRYMTITTGIALVLLGCVFLLLVVVPLLPTYDPYTQDLGSSLLPPFERLDDGRLSVFGTDQARPRCPEPNGAGRMGFAVHRAFRCHRQHGDRHGAGPRRRLLPRLGRDRHHGSRGPSAFHPPRAFADRGYGAIGVDGCEACAAARASQAGWSTAASPAPWPCRFASANLCSRPSPRAPRRAWNIRKHLLPNVLPQMVIVGSFDLGQIIILEAR